MLLEHEKATREGKLWAQLLGKATRRLSKRLSEPRIAYAWARAYDVHVWGFHEAKYGSKTLERIYNTLNGS